jgi:hypothetical protein
VNSDRYQIGVALADKRIKTWKIIASRAQHSAAQWNRGFVILSIDKSQFKKVGSAAATFAF